MDIGLKKPLSLKIHSQCSGLETAGSLYKGAEVSDVRLSICSLGTTDAPEGHTYLSCQQSHILRVSAPAEVMAGPLGRALGLHRVYFWSTSCGNFSSASIWSALAVDVEETPGKFDRHRIIRFY